MPVFADVLFEKAVAVGNGVTWATSSIIPSIAEFPIVSMAFPWPDGHVLEIHVVLCNVCCVQVVRESGGQGKQCAVPELRDRQDIS